MSLVLYYFLVIFLLLVMYISWNYKNQLKKHFYQLIGRTLPICYEVEKKLQFLTRMVSTLFWVPHLLPYIKSFTWPNIQDIKNSSWLIGNKTSPFLSAEIGDNFCPESAVNIEKSLNLVKKWSTPVDINRVDFIAVENHGITTKHWRD